MGITEMPIAIVLGCPPYVAFMGPQKLPLGVDEFTVAGVSYRKNMIPELDNFISHLHLW